MTLFTSPTLAQEKLTTLLSKTTSGQEILSNPATNPTVSKPSATAGTLARQSSTGSVTSNVQNVGVDVGALAGKVLQLATSPLTLAQEISKLPTLLLGTQQEKLETALSIIPTQVEATTTTVTPQGETIVQQTNGSLTELIHTVIENQKTISQNQAELWNQRTLATTQIEIPEIPNPLGFLGDVGNTLKWALIGIGGIIVLVIIARALKGGKK